MLIAILLPSLAKAREQAKTIVCAAAMKQQGTMISTFAAEHDGRGPGRAWFSEDGGKTPYSDGALDWNDILNIQDLNHNQNIEFTFTGNNPMATLYGKLELQDTPGYIFPHGMLMCPNFTVLSTWTWAYEINYDAEGGDGGFTNSQYGQVITPQQFDSSKYTNYCYGAVLGRFLPGQTLLVESDTDYPDTDVNGMTNAGSGPPTYSALKGQVIPLASGLESYDAKNGFFSFRHPYGKRMNVMSFDTHVEPKTVADELYDARLFSIPNGIVPMQ